MPELEDCECRRTVSIVYRVIAFSCNTTEEWTVRLDGVDTMMRMRQQ